MRWHTYWALVAGNIWAMPLEALITGLASLVLIRPARRLLRSLKETERRAAAAHQIAADLHEQLTGERHPAAPDRPETT